MRWNLALTYRVDAADEFLRALGRRAPAHQPHWDAVGLLDVVPELDAADWPRFELERLERYLEGVLVNHWARLPRHRAPAARRRRAEPCGGVRRLYIARASSITSTTAIAISSSRTVARTAQRAGADGVRRVRESRRGRPASTGVSSGLASGAGPAGAVPIRLTGREGSGVPGGVAALGGPAGSTAGSSSGASPAARPSGASSAG